ncbi:hypothetical protein [Endozoicomonas acroporae]|uniref:hypothetical protein n=1 Tax=Endozoicomonas acroporae TaxID=1701104 RepID=UPI003D798DAF
MTPDQVIQEFARKPDRNKYLVAITRFKAECCQKGLLLKGRRVSPDEVANEFQAARATLELARFMEECCLKGLLLKGRQVTPEAVVRAFPDSLPGKLGIARFMEQCCLRGLPFNSQQVTPGEVVNAFPDSPEGKLGKARFKAECCLRGLVLFGQQVTPDAVVNDYQAANATLELAHFKAECCLKGLLLKGRHVTSDEVVKDFPDNPEGRLGLAHFMERCCLKGMALNGQQITPEAVVKDFPESSDGKLGIVRFRDKCCLRGLTLNGQQITPESVVRDYERGGWLLEKAVFYSQLALNARELNSACLDDRKVVTAFNEVPGDHSAKQIRYLIQKLKQSQKYEETSEAQETLQEAWQILNSVSVKDDEHNRLQCLLKFMAMQHGLLIDHQVVSAKQVLRSITTLRHSCKNSRIHFFFLAHCYITSQSINGQVIHKKQVLNCLQHFPEGCKRRHALVSWFEQRNCEVHKARIIDSMLYKRANAVASGGVSPHGYAASASQHKAAVPVRRKYPVATAGGPGFPERQASRLNVLILKTLEIIQEINDTCDVPAILVTGSYARFLQNLCSSFNDIDIICTTDESARTLFEKLQVLNTDRNSEIPKSMTISRVPGCPLIKLPTAYNIQLKDGDLGMKVMDLQVSVDALVTDRKTARLAIDVPGVSRPVWCLSFAEETGLLNNTLAYLADHLDLLTDRLQRGEIFSIPRTILFNFPQNPEEHIYGLLMRSLLTLNKARQFIALHCESKPGKPDCQTHQRQKQQQRLLVLTENLQVKLNSHIYRQAFEHRVNSWLLTAPHESDYEIKRRDFVTTLLAMVQPE